MPKYQVRHAQTWLIDAENIAAAQEAWNAFDTPPDSDSVDVLPWDTDAWAEADRLLLDQLRHELSETLSAVLDADDQVAIVEYTATEYDDGYYFEKYPSIKLTTGEDLGDEHELPAISEALDERYEHIGPYARVTFDLTKNTIDVIGC